MSRLLPLGLVALLFHLGCQQCCTDRDCALAASAENRENNEICEDGACVVEPAVRLEAPGCADDDECGEGAICAGTEQRACAPAPRCLRLDREFVGRLDGTNAGTVTASTTGCRVAFNLAFPGELESGSASVENIGLDGAFADEGAIGMEPGGRWDSVQHVGTFRFPRVGGGTHEVTFGTDTYGCVNDDECVGQVFTGCLVVDNAGRCCTEPGGLQCR